MSGITIYYAVIGVALVVAVLLTKSLLPYPPAERPTWHVFYTVLRGSDGQPFPTYYVGNKVGRTTPPAQLPGQDTEWLLVTEVGFQTRASAMKAAFQHEAKHRSAAAELGRCLLEPSSYVPSPRYLDPSEFTC